MKKSQSNNQIKLVLASQSPARKRLLKKLGYPFLTRPAYLDEKSYESRIRNPKTLVATLAREKARTIASKINIKYPGAIVIGSDQMLVIGNQVFGKPEKFELACRQLQALSGKSIRLLTAVCVTSSRGENSMIQVTRMKARKLSRTEIESYVKRDDPLFCAGGFKFEEHGLLLFESVQTDDPSSIEGLPMLGLLKLLKKHGLPGPIF